MPPRLHMIGNAHLDPVFLWRWPEGCAEAIGTCWAAAELLADHPGVIFTRGEAVVYRWIEELDPALFARIRQLVRDGRWALVNGWWLQPDCNLPDGEAFIRQGLYGKEYFRDRFGIDVTVGYNVDSFGHAATLPMLLRHTGFLHYVFMRPMEHERALPSCLFDWEAPDGSSVGAFRIPIAYAASGDVEPRLAAVQALAELEGTPLMCFYGVGNHGGGPTRRELTGIARFEAEGGDVVFSDPARYFSEVAGLARPTVRGELQMHAIGCYSVVSSLKALNRLAEARLAQAEAAGALAQLHAGAVYPRTHLRELWETLLFNHFHDILCGTSVASGVRDAEQAFGSVIQGADQVINAALRHLGATVAPGSDAKDAAFLVFNLNGIAQHTVLEYEPWTGDWETATYRLLDDEGAVVAHQELHPENYGHPSMHRIVFAPRVPAFGYRLYRYVKAPTPMNQSSLQVATTSLESAAWRLVIDTETGGIAELMDKRSGRALFAGTAHQPLIIDDSSDTWSHDLDRFSFEGQTFACQHVEVPEQGPLRFAYEGRTLCERVEMLEQGPVRAALRVRARAGASTMVTTYRLYDDPSLPLEIHVTLDWHEHRRLLRFAYPLALAAPVFRYEVPYGSVERKDDGREWPGQRWVLISGGEGYGIALANDAKYSYAAKDGVFYVTAVRSPVFAHWEPMELDPRGDYPCTDHGSQSFVFRLLAGPAIGPFVAHQLADNLLRPPIATPHVARGGTGPRCASLLDLQTSSSSATWLKAAEDGQGPVLRVLEHEGRADTIALPASGDRFTAAPYELLTLRRDDHGHWYQSDGLEGRSRGDEPLQLS